MRSISCQHVTHGAKLRSLDTFQLANRHMCLGILSPDLWWATSYGERVVIPTVDSLGMQEEGKSLK